MNLEYKTRIVAFIDVMGFRQLIFSDNAGPTIRSYYETLDEFLTEKTIFYEIMNGNDDFKKLFVSDSIILSVQLTKNLSEDVNIAARFFGAIGLLQYTLASRALIWTRGAVSLGDLHIDADEKTLYGPAFIHAFDLEKAAGYPRVIVDPRFLGYFQHTPQKFVEQINAKQPGSLLGRLSPQFDLYPSDNDAIQVDWFAHAFIEKNTLEGFFEDLVKRRNLNQALFDKSNRLLRYLLKSAIICREHRTVHLSKMSELLGIIRSLEEMQ